MTIEQLRAWLRDWVAQATGVSAEEILDSKPLENYGLSSRDAVVLSGELENLLGTRLDATVAYEYPTIELLADRLLNAPAAPSRKSAPRGSRRDPTLRSLVFPAASQAPTMPKSSGLCWRNPAQAPARCQWVGGPNTPPIQ